MHRRPPHFERLHFDYTTIGHVTADVMEDGSRRAGGTALYSALQASRLGLRTLVITRGVPAEIEQLMGPFASELELQVHAAPLTTTLLTRGSGADRTQRVLAWAGEIEEPAPLDSEILHLAPVARETPTRWRARAAFVGLTAQGLVRRWSGPRARIHLAPPSAAQESVVERCSAVVLNDRERASCAGIIARAKHANALVAITAGAARKTLLLPDGSELRLRAERVRDARDDLGAGDVFAAAFFVALHEQRAPRDAARFASGAAALRIEGTGTAAIADRRTIEARLQRAARE